MKESEKNPIKETVETFEAVSMQEENAAIEILPNMTVEEMRALFFDKALIEPKYKVWQLNSKGHRYYYRFNEDGTPEFYPSVTTILSQTMPTPPHLVKWIAYKGYEQAEAYKQERAYYGTFMHAQFEELIINRTYDLDALKEKLKAYMEINRLPDTFIYYADDLKKDVLAFAQFVIDYDVRPMAVEIALVHPDYKYAGMIDLPCSLLVKPGKEERVNAIVDFKSGRKGFFEEHEIQLHMYKEMWNANFKDLQIERVYNFSPKDWRKKPSYNFTDQTESPNAAKIPYILQLAAIEDAKRDNVFTSVSGSIILDAEVKPDLTNNVISLTLAELINSKAPKEETPGEEISINAEELEKQAENTPNLPANGSKSRNGTNTRAKKENATDAKKEKNNLLNAEPDI